MPTDEIHDTVCRDLQVRSPSGVCIDCQLTLTVYTDGRAWIELASDRLGAYRFEDQNWWACFARLRLGFERNGWLVLCNAARRHVSAPRPGDMSRFDPFSFRVLVPPEGRSTFVWLDAFAPADLEYVASIEQIETDRAEARAAWATLQQHMRRLKAERARAAGVPVPRSGGPVAAPSPARLERDARLAAPWGYCLQCGSPELVPIVYGPETPALRDLTVRHRLFFGGPLAELVHGEAAQWLCAPCSARQRDHQLAGGPGETLDTAIAIRGVWHPAVVERIQLQALIERFGLDAEVAQAPNGWREVRRARVDAPEGDLHYDAVTIALADGAERTIYFDVSDLFDDVPTPLGLPVPASTPVHTSASG